MGALFAFIGSIQQIVFDVFERPMLLPWVFAAIAGPMALSSYANSRLVMRLGSRRILLAALGLFTALSALHLAVAGTAGESVGSFILLQALTMGCFGLIGANAGALAMEPLGHVAGTASSVQGLITTVGGALIGFAIGQQFDGTTIPFLVGFTLCGGAALAMAYWANRGRGATRRRSGGGRAGAREPAWLRGAKQGRRPRRHPGGGRDLRTRRRERLWGALHGRQCSSPAEIPAFGAPQSTTLRGAPSPG
jgi:DHA1 family bicyclomycin/chloramphenicol resistance-like MFS transporter